LPAIYGEQAAAVVVFVSAEYAARDWTRLERGPRWPGLCASGGNTCCRLDSMTPRFPGWCRTWSRLTLLGRTPDQFADLIAVKLADLGITAPGRAGSLARDAGRRGRYGRERLTCDGWECTQRSACPGCPQHNGN
jgi:hypothetical protein